MDPWITLGSRVILERPPWLTVCEEDVVLPNGTRIPDYLTTTARDYAMVFALLSDGTVPLVSQYKHGLRGTSLDLPAGYLDVPDEDPLQAARRELQEETGLTSGDWRALGRLTIDTNRGPTAAHIFLATGVERTESQHLDPTEDLEVTYLFPRQVRERVVSGDISSIASVAGIMLALDALRGEE